MEGLLWVFVGGGVGSALRYAVARWLEPVHMVGTTGIGGFPWATFAVNVVGAFVLAFMAHRVTGLEQGPRLLLTTGLMGGFTTYSTFNFEVLRLAHDGRTGLAAAYILATVLGALLLGWLGWRLGS